MDLAPGSAAVGGECVGPWPVVLPLEVDPAALLLASLPWDSEEPLPHV